MSEICSSCKETVFKFLCADLGRKAGSVPDDVKTYMDNKIASAYERLVEDGVDMSDVTASRLDLWAMYAAYLYRRKDSNEAMPLSLRLALNDAKVASITKGAGA